MQPGSAGQVVPPDSEVLKVENTHFKDLVLKTVTYLCNVDINYILKLYSENIRLNKIY